MRKKLSLLAVLSLTVFLFVGCGMTKLILKNTVNETENETNAETEAEINQSKYEDRKIDFNVSDLEISNQTYAEGTTEEQIKEYNDFMNELFPYGVEWQVKMFNKEMNIDDYTWNEEVLKEKKATKEEFHNIIQKTISNLKNKGFYPDLNSATCQVFTKDGEIQGLVVYTPWISDTEKTRNNFEVHLGKDKSVIGAGIKSVE